MGVPVRDYLKRRRDRALGSILGHAERELFDGMSPKQQADFRRIVLDAIGSYHDSVLDLVKAEDGVRNDEVISLLERIDSRIGHQPTTSRQPPRDPGSDEHPKVVGSAVHG